MILLTPGQVAESLEGKKDTKHTFLQTGSHFWTLAASSALWWADLRGRTSDTVTSSGKAEWEALGVSEI